MASSTASFRDAQLLAGHRARPVEDDREVDRRAALVVARGAAIRGQQEALAVGVGPDEPTVRRTLEGWVDATRSWPFLLEELTGDRDEAIDLFLLGPRKRATDVELDVG